MKKLLLDTHALIWFLEDDVKLPPNVKTLLENSDNEVFISMFPFGKLP